MKNAKIHLFSFLLTALLQTALYGEYHHVEGCSVCHSPISYNSPNIAFINDIILTPNSGYKEVVFTDINGTNSYADGDATYNGICEVCHTVNNHHNNDGHDNTSHFDGLECTKCHLHGEEFAPPLEQSHRTHLDYRGKGPLIKECTVCHQDPYADPYIFRDGNDLSNTTACDNCHSPWGAYPGGDPATSLMDPAVGAKANFRTGVYESDGHTLKPGKEKWCVTCHDDKPSTSHYDGDPDKMVSPFVVDYLDPTVTYSTDSGWINRSWNGMVAHKRATTSGATLWKNAWATYDFTVPQNGSYAIMMKWSSDSGSCNAANAALVSITDSNGTTTKSYDQVGESPEFSLVQTFDMAAGPVTFKIQKNNARCSLIAGPIQIVPQAGSGGTVVIAPMVAGDDSTWGYYATGHGVSGVQCTECHDPKKKHIDYDARTHNMGLGKWNVINPWGDSYRLRTKDPIAGASLCARCHDMELIWDRAGKVAQTNYKNATAGNNNLHAYHMGIANALTNGGDSDWDGVADSDPRCLNCHNVHGSTKPHMFRDGNLASTPYTSDKKPMFPHGYEVYTKATWKPLLQGGSYEVFARWPAVEGAATNAPFTIKSSAIFSTTVKVDQTIHADTWVSLGTYEFGDDNRSYVILNDKETDGTVVADAVKFVGTQETVTIDNGDNSDNVSGTYSVLGVHGDLSGTAGFNGDYDAIAAGTTLSDDINGSTIDFDNPLLMEQRNIYLPNFPNAGIGYNKICKNCHATDDEDSSKGEKEIRHFTGPKILNRFEEKRWVFNDGTQDAEVYITARDYDSNISSVTLDLTSLGGGVLAMTPVGQQTYRSTVPANLISGLSDSSYKLPVTATDTDGQSVTDETYLFPKEGPDTVYLDTDSVEINNVNFTRFAVNTGGASWNRLPNDITYFGPGYRFSVVASEYSNMYGIWKPEIPTNGKYEVYAFWDDLTGSVIGSGASAVTLTSGDVKFTAFAADGTYEVIKNQAAGGGGWNYIGTFSFLEDDSNYVRQTSVGDHTMVFDAMKFVRVNAEPVVRLGATQRKKATRIITADSNYVTVTATARDYDTADTPDTMTFDWSGTDAALFERSSAIGSYGEQLAFRPYGLAPGIYTVQVTVSDTGGASTTVRLALQIPVTVPVLGDGDTDGDGISDTVEGFTDTDEDGIPNYLDASLAANEIPDSGTLAIATQAGLKIRVGETALGAGSDDGVITDAELTAYGADGVGGLVDGTGGLFDFDIVGLDMVGQSVKVVLPLQEGATIPANAKYRKYYAATGWTDFVIDADNAVYSAAKVGGVCPEAGSTGYTAGLTVGHECIQLSVQDGGPNDADGLANAQVK